MGYNRFIGMGRLTRDVELKNTASGIEVINFNVAVDRAIKGADGEKAVDFIDCVAWRQTAAFVDKYFSKGDMIHFEGILQSRKYVDKNENNRTAWEVQVDHVTFCGGKSDSAPREIPAEIRDVADIITGAEDNTAPNTDDLPF